MREIKRSQKFIVVHPQQKSYIDCSVWFPLCIKKNSTKGLRKLERDNNGRQKKRKGLF